MKPSGCDYSISWLEVTVMMSIQAVRARSTVVVLGWMTLRRTSVDISVMLVFCFTLRCQSRGSGRVTRELGHQ